MVLIENKDLLTQLDNISGDGDLGISMEKTAYSILFELDKPIVDGMAGLLSRCAVSINKNAPSTMGTLISFAIMDVAKSIHGFDQLDDMQLISIPNKMADSIMFHGRALLGDKTVLDSLIPYAHALVEQYKKELNYRIAAEYAAVIAESAAYATKGCIAKIGRAKWIAERSRDCPDGGAVVCALVLKAIVGKSSTVEWLKQPLDSEPPRVGGTSSAK